MGNIKYSEIIKSVSEDQNQILYNIIQLYNNGEAFELDPTASSLGFYNKSTKYPVPIPKYLFDVEPISEGVIKIGPLDEWPLDNNSVKSVCVDLPFVVSCGPSIEKERTTDKKNNIIARRFSGYYPREEIFKSYYWFLMESFRVLKPGGICVWKTQRTISASKTLMTPEMSWKFAEELGFYTLDRFTLIAKNRLWSGKIKKQMHSRSFDSQFYVFQKPDGTSNTKQIDYYYWATEEYQTKLEKFKNNKKSENINS